MNCFRSSRCESPETIRSLLELLGELRAAKDALQFREQRGAADEFHLTGLRRVDQAAGSTTP
jgi:hypothetical protein